MRMIVHFVFSGSAILDIQATLLMEGTPFMPCRGLLKSEHKMPFSESQSAKPGYEGS